MIGTLDPVLETVLRGMRDAGRRPVSDSTPEQARAQMALRRVPPTRAMHSVEDRVIEADGLSVRVRDLVPRPEATGILVYVHGGGWVIGEADDFDALGRELAFHGDTRVLLIDYDLAPEFPYPHALNQVDLVVSWALREHPGVPVIVAGDSAGANLATVAALRAGIAARAAGLPQPIRAQILSYPVTDSDLDRESYHEQPVVPTLLSREEMAWFWDLYVPRVADRAHPEITPLHSPDLAVLPPTIIHIAQIDPLRDEGLAYAEALRAAGVDVNLTVHETLCHGFLGLAALVPAAAAARDRLAASIRVLKQTERGTSTPVEQETE